MSTSTKFLSQYIDIDTFLSSPKRSFYFVLSLSHHTGNIDIQETTQIANDMCSKVDIFICFLEKKTGNFSLLYDGHESRSEIMDIFERIITKSLYSNSSLIGSFGHKKRSSFKSSLCRISVDKSSSISIDTEQKCCCCFCGYFPV